MSRKVIQIAASALLIGGSLTYLLSTSLSEEIEYFYSADVVIMEQSRLAGQRFRMGGYVVPGSIFHKPGTLEYQFDVRPMEAMLKYQEARDRTISVRYTGIVPDTFKDDGEVIVTGGVQSDGTFVANDLLAKCPSKYEAAEKNKGEY